MRIRLVAVVIMLLGGGCDGGDAPTIESSRTGPNRHLMVVLDGLRPDYVTAELMPNLYALGRRGVVFTAHHAVYPTVTRVNASSISTGAYPETHGLMGNTVFFPEVDARRFLSTSERDNLLRTAEAEDGRLLTAPTLGETMQAAGMSVLVVSSGSSGSSLLLNHTVAGGGIIHYDYALPASLETAVRAALGPVPEPGTPNDARNRYAVDAYLQVGLPELDPTVTLMWLSDPDTTAHAHGIGHPLSNDALTRVDAQFGRVAGGAGRSRATRPDHRVGDIGPRLFHPHWWRRYGRDRRAVSGCARRRVTADRGGRRGHLCPGRPTTRRSARS